MLVVRKIKRIMPDLTSALFSFFVRSDMTAFGLSEATLQP